MLDCRRSKKAFFMTNCDFLIEVSLRLGSGFKPLMPGVGGKCVFHVFVKIHIPSLGYKETTEL
jgi:hypothetical protein